MIEKNEYKVRSEIDATCDEYFIKRAEELEELKSTEKQAAADLRAIKAKLREKTKKPKAGPASKSNKEKTRHISETSSADVTVSLSKRRAIPDSDEEVCLIARLIET